MSRKKKSQSEQMWIMMWSVMGIAFVTIAVLFMSGFISSLFGGGMGLINKFCQEHPEKCGQDSSGYTIEDIMAYDSNAYIFCAIKAIAEGRYEGPDSCKDFLFEAQTQKESKDTSLIWAITYRIPELFSRIFKASVPINPTDTITSITLNNKNYLTGLTSGITGAYGNAKPMLLMPPQSIDCDQTEDYPSFEWEEDSKAIITSREKRRNVIYKFMIDNIQPEKGFLWHYYIPDEHNMYDFAPIDSGTPSLFKDHLDAVHIDIWRLLADANKMSTEDDRYYKGIDTFKSILDQINQQGKFGGDDYIVVHYDVPLYKGFNIENNEADRYLKKTSLKLKKYSIVTSCKIKNFYLPQEISNWNEWIKGMGDPQYLVYWESFPRDAEYAWSGESIWMQNTIDLVFAWGGVIAGVGNLGKSAVGFMTEKMASKLFAKKIASEGAERLVEQGIFISGKKMYAYTVKESIRETSEEIITRTTKEVFDEFGEKVRVEFGERVKEKTIKLLGKDIAIREASKGIGILAAAKSQEIFTAAVKHYKNRLVKLGIPLTAAAIGAAYLDSQMAKRNPVERSIVFKMPYAQPKVIGQLSNMEREKSHIMVKTNHGLLPFHLASPCFADLEINASIVKCEMFYGSTRDDPNLDALLPSDHCEKPEDKKSMSISESCYNAEINGDLIDEGIYPEVYSELIGYNSVNQENNKYGTEIRKIDNPLNPLKLFNLEYDENQQTDRVVVHKIISRNSQSTPKPANNKLTVIDPYTGMKFIFGTGFSSEDGSTKFKGTDCGERDDPESHFIVKNWKKYNTAHKNYYGGPEQSCQQVNLETVEGPLIDNDPDKGSFIKGIKVYDSGKKFVMALSESNYNFNVEFKIDDKPTDNVMNVNPLRNMLWYKGKAFCQYTIPPSDQWIKSTPDSGYYFEKFMTLPYYSSDGYKNSYIFGLIKSSVYAEPAPPSPDDIPKITSKTDNDDAAKILQQHHQIAYRQLNEEFNTGKPGWEDAFRDLDYKDIFCHIEIEIKPSDEKVFDSQDTSHNYLDDVECENGKLKQYKEKSKLEELMTANDGQSIDIADEMRKVLDFYCKIKELYTKKRLLQFEREVGLIENEEFKTKDGIPSYSAVKSAHSFIWDRNSGLEVKLTDADHDTIADIASIGKSLTEPKIMADDISNPKDGRMDIIKIRDCLILSQRVFIEKKGKDEGYDERNYCVAETDTKANAVRWAPIAGAVIGGIVGSIAPGGGTAAGIKIGDALGSAIQLGYIYFYEKKHGRKDQWPGTKT